MDLQDKVMALYEVVSDTYYKNIPDLKVSTEDGSMGFNSALLFSTLTALNNGKILLFGEYGGGKTTSCEYVLCVYKGIPLDILQSAQIRGHPELTEEKIKGRPDLAALNSGKAEQVVWEYFPLLPGHIIDEINRIPESKQSIILEGVGRGIWKYLREIVFSGKTPLFATNNYADKGNMELIPPMKDRFDVAVECKFPGSSKSLEIMLDYGNGADELLKDPTASQAIIDLLQEGRGALEKTPDGLTKLQGALEQYKLTLAKNLQVEVLSYAELEEIGAEIGDVPLDDQARAFMHILINELNWSPNYGQKRSGEQPTEAGHDQGFLFNSVDNAGSQRMNKAIVHYARSLAWLTKSEEVTLEHVSVVAPYAMWHQVNWTDSYLKQFRDHDREDPFDLYVSKQAVASVLERTRENFSYLMDALNLADEVKDGTLNFSALAKKYGDHQHPVFREILTNTERETEW